MKLELKHIVPYLPYRLKCMYSDRQIVEIDPLATETNYDDRTTPLFHCFGEFACKPLLLPLSDLTKEIEHNGEKFVPARYYHDERKYGVTDTKNHPMSDSYLPKLKQIDDKPYWWIQKLFEWHFDVFGLIDHGLAIDKNTITQ